MPRNPSDFYPNPLEIYQKNVCPRRCFKDWTKAINAMALWTRTLSESRDFSIPAAEVFQSRTSIIQPRQTPE
ncbi:MAG: hypothetical protein Q9188_004746 [Gyalolechia gomerana]